MAASLLLTFSSEAFPTTTHVVSVVGREAISQPYTFHIGLEINDESFDPDRALRAQATLHINQGSEAEPYFVSGVVVAIELLHQYEGKSLYSVTLVPKLWHLRHDVHSRIFTDATIIEIIEAVLKHGGLETVDFRFQVLHSYPKLEHVCQYKESGLDFISRWMEREGLYYFFEHEEQGEKLVITDSISFHGGLTSGHVRYVPLSGDDSMALEALDSFMAKHSALPANVTLTDYDYLRPTLDLHGSHSVDQQGLGEVRVFGENLNDAAEGARYAKVRAQEILTRQKVFYGHGRVFHLRPNYRFGLEEHPNPSYNGKSYLVTELEHAANQSATDARIKALLGIAEVPEDEYSARLTAVPADVQYRSPKRKPWPRVDGYELAQVDGEATSDYAQIDKHGRYKCRVLFDESDLVDGSATTWIRMMQPHGGGVEGFHFPLRKGTEVLVFYLAGDPDRPVIAGVGPNPLKPSPVTSANYTRNVIQTGGRNRLELEDLAGEERVTLSTPYSNTYLLMGCPSQGHELILHTDDNAHVDVGQTLQVTTGSWREDDVGDYFDTTVEGTVTDTFKDTHTTTIEGAVTETYNNGQTTTVNKAEHVATYNLGSTTTVNGGLTLENYNVGHETHVKGGQKLHVETGDQTITVDAGNKTETISGNYDLTINGSTKVALMGAEEKTTWGPFKEVRYADDIRLTYGYSIDTFLGAKADLVIGAKADAVLGGAASVTVGGKFELIWPGEHTISPSETKAKAMRDDITGLEKSVKGLKTEDAGLSQKMSQLQSDVANLQQTTAILIIIG